MLSPDAKPFIPTRKVSPMLSARSEYIPHEDDPRDILRKIHCMEPRTVIFVDMQKWPISAAGAEAKALAGNPADPRHTLIVRIRDPTFTGDFNDDERAYNVIVHPARAELWISMVAVQICASAHTTYISICARHADRSILRATIGTHRASVQVREYNIERDESPPIHEIMSIAKNNPFKILKKIYKRKPCAVVLVDVGPRFSVAARTETKAIADLEAFTTRDNIFVAHIHDPGTSRDDHDEIIANVHVDRSRLELWITIAVMQIGMKYKFVEHLSLCTCHTDRVMLLKAINGTAGSKLILKEYDYELDPPIPRTPKPTHKQRMLIIPPADLGISRAHCILNNPRNANLSVELSWLLSAIIPARVDTVEDFITTWGIARSPSDYDDDARILRTLCAMFLMLDSLDPDFPFDDRAISREMRAYFRGRRDDFPADIPTYAPLTPTERAMIIAHIGARA